jgi:hypothetical protein
LVVGGLGLPELKDPALGANEGRRGIEDVDDDELQEDAGEVDLRPDRAPLTADPNAIGREGVGRPLVVVVAVIDDEVDVAVAVEVVAVVVALDLAAEGRVEPRPSLVGLGGPCFSLTVACGTCRRVVIFFSRRGEGTFATGVFVCVFVMTLERSAELLAERRYFNPMIFWTSDGSVIEDP